jgi:hypothetical protein
VQGKCHPPCANMIGDQSQNSQRYGQARENCTVAVE